MSRFAIILFFFATETIADHKRDFMASTSVNLSPVNQRPVYPIT